MDGGDVVAKSIKVFAITVVVLGALVILNVWREANSFGPPVQYVVPDGYRGPFYVVEDPSALPVPMAGGAYLLRIPSTGVIRVRSLDFESRWHEIFARFESGETLPWGDPKPAEVALRGGSNVSGSGSNGAESNWLVYFVGTKADMANGWSMKVPISGSPKP